MPAQKRPLPPPASDDDSDVRVAERHAAAAVSRGGGGGSREKDGEAAAGHGSEEPREPRHDDPNDDEEGGGGSGGDGSDGDSESTMSAGSMDDFMMMKLVEIWKEVQCPICLGIIQKTRTVMECLHRFCRDCIDRSMRLGNNECPACRTHCASRRSLRDDPNYDALIAALYPDIDKYEEEELAFGEEEKNRNKKIQETIEETIRKQSEAVGRKRSKEKETADPFARKYRRNVRRRGRGKTVTPDAPSGSDDEDREEENANDAPKDLSSADDYSPELRHNRGRKRSVSQPSPARTVGSTDHGLEENNELVGGKEILATSPLRGEMLAWGKNGTRSQTRHGSSAGSNGRTTKGGRIPKLVDHLRTTDEMDKEFHLYLARLPLYGQSIPNLETPYLSCRPTLSIRHLVQFIALRLSREAEELEMYIRIDHSHRSIVSKGSSTSEVKRHILDGLERLGEDKLLSELHPSFASSNGDLELLYALKTGDKVKSQF